MIKNLLITVVLFSSILISPVKANAADKDIINNYLDHWVKIFTLEKQIINNLTFKEASHFPFSRSPYAAAKNITLYDNFQKQWIFTIHPYNITPYILEKISQILRIANLPVNYIYAHSLEINGKKYIGTLEKEVKRKHLHTIKDVLRKEKSIILAQEPISYLFETEFLLQYTQDRKFLIQATDKIYYYPKAENTLTYTDFEEIFQYNSDLFGKELLLTLKTKNYTLLEQTINPEKTENIKDFFNISTLRGFSRDYCKRIHQYCLANSLRGWDEQISKTISLLNSIPKKQLLQILDEPSINDYKIYKNYKNSVLNRKEKIVDYFTAYYKHLDPEKKFYLRNYSNEELKAIIDSLKEKEKQLQDRLDETNAAKKIQTKISSGVFPEAWMIVFCKRIKFIDKNKAYETINNLMTKGNPNSEQKQTAKNYLTTIKY